MTLPDDGSSSSSLDFLRLVKNDMAIFLFVAFWIMCIVQQEVEKGVSILDAVYQAGYSDQPHMTRSLKYFIGQTPAQIVRLNQPE